MMCIYDKEPIQNESRGMVVSRRECKLAFCDTSKKTSARDQKEFCYERAGLGIASGERHHWQDDLEDIFVS